MAKDDSGIVRNRHPLAVITGFYFLLQIRERLFAKNTATLIY